MVKVSVIIPNYNHVDFLSQRLESVINQTFNDFEVIILDDCSTDDSLTVIERYRNHPKVSHIITNTTNTGSPFIQWSKGIELAEGEYIWIAESDDWCEFNFLEELMKYATKFPAASLIYSDTFFVTQDNKYLREQIDADEYVFFEEGMLLKQKLINGLKINNASAVVFKKDVSSKNLSELISYTKHGDYFFWIQIAKEGNAVFVNQPLNYCRILENSVTRLSWNKNIQSLKEHIKIFRLLQENLSLFSFRQRLKFYDNWHLKFLDMFDNIRGLLRVKMFFNLFFSKKINVYFLSKFLYSKVVRQMKVLKN